jgi:ribose-phosphate pyrophosphokinase
VIVDDICDGGGTFVGLAETIGRPASSMRLWTTHGIYSRGLGALLDAFGMVGSTNSFPTDTFCVSIRDIDDLIVTTAQEALT